MTIVDHSGAHATGRLEQCEAEHGQQRVVGLVVLHTTAILALILVFHLLLVGYYQLVVFLHILIAAAAHLPLVQTGLALAVAFVHLCLEDAELVEFSLACLSQAPIAVGTVLQAEPEVRELADDLRIVAHGPSQVARLLQQQGAVEERHEVVGLQLQDEVEVLDAAVVVAHLCTQQSAVVVSKEIVGVEVESRVVVGHRPAQVVLVETGQCAVDVTAHMTGEQMDGLVEKQLGILPFLARQTDD